VECKIGADHILLGRPILEDMDCITHWKKGAYVLFKNGYRIEVKGGVDGSFKISETKDARDTMSDASLTETDASSEELSSTVTDCSDSEDGSEDSATVYLLSITRDFNLPRPDLDLTIGNIGVNMADLKVPQIDLTQRALTLEMDAPNQVFGLTYSNSKSAEVLEREQVLIPLEQIRPEVAGIGVRISGDPEVIGNKAAVDIMVDALLKFREVFVPKGFVPKPMPGAIPAVFRIKEGAILPKPPSVRFSPAETTMLNAWDEAMSAAGQLQMSHSAVASRVIPLLKPEYFANRQMHIDRGENPLQFREYFRLVSDYSPVNKVVEPWRSRTKTVNEVIRDVINDKYTCIADAVMAFHQCPVSECSRWMSAIMLPQGLKELVSLGQGFCNSPAACEDLL
jgi:hypothetical protein